MEQHVRLFSLNIHLGGGYLTNPDGFESLLKDIWGQEQAPDIVALQEVKAGTAKILRRRFANCFYIKDSFHHYLTDHPLTVRHEHGEMIISRWRLHGLPPMCPPDLRDYWPEELLRVLEGDHWPERMLSAAVYTPWGKWIEVHTVHVQPATAFDKKGEKKNPKGWYKP